MPPRRHHPDPDVAAIAALIGDPGRAAILHALLDGGELPASELAARAGVTPQSATAHLKKLVAGGLLETHAAGRHRFFRLHSPDVGHAMEALAVIAKPARVVALAQSTTLQRLRTARSCYDHLAGRLGVALTDRFVERGALLLERDAFELTRSGERLMREIGVDVATARESRRSFARACTDWTERRPHLAGSLGAAVLAHFLAHGWVKRSPTDRALTITERGCVTLAHLFQIEL